MYKNISLMDEESFGAIEGYVSDQIEEQLTNRCNRWGVDVSLAKEKVKKRFAILDSLYVREEKRNLGIGTELLTQFIEQCRKEGADVIFLEADTSENNAFNLKDWYRRYGFCDLIYDIMYLNLKKSFWVLTTINGITSEKQMEAVSLESLIEEISKTKRGQMEYQVYSSLPYNFENLLYTHHKD